MDYKATSLTNNDFLNHNDHEDTVVHISNNSFSTESTIHFQGLIEAIKHNNISLILTEVNKINKYNQSNSTPINISDIPPELLSVCTSFISTNSPYTETAIRKVIVILSNIVDRLDSDSDFSSHDFSSLVITLCRLRPLESHTFSTCIYLISSILDLGICFTDFSREFPWDDIDKFVTFDTLAYEISKLYLVLGNKYLSEPIVIETFPRIFRMYIDKCLYSPHLIFVLTIFCHVQGFMDDNMWRTIFSLVHKCKGESRASILKVCTSLVSNNYQKFISQFEDIFNIITKPTLNRALILNSGFDFFTESIHIGKFEFPMKLLQELVKFICNEIEEMSEQDITSALRCLLYCITYSDSESMINYFTEYHIISIICNFLECDNTDNICITLDIIEHISTVLKATGHLQEVIESLESDDFLKLIQEQTTNDNGFIHQKANHLISLLEISQDED